MSQRSITLSLITLLAGAAAGAALMAGRDASRPPPAAIATLATPAVAQPTAGAQLPSATTWRSVPEVYPKTGGTNEADVRNESVDSLGNLGDGS